MIIVDRISQLPNGAPVDAGTEVKLRREIDGALLQTQLTDINGWVTFRMNGSPGPVYTEVSVGGETRFRYGRAVAQVGSWFEGEWQQFMDMVIPGVLQNTNPDALKVIPGTGLQVRVSPGSAIAEGVLGQYYDHENIGLVANGSGNPRIDRIVLQLTSAGPEAGKVTLAVYEGATAASPVAPEVPNMDDVAQLILADVRVQSGVNVIQESDITDRRQAASFVPPGGITTARLADSSVTTPKLANSSVTPAKLDRAYAPLSHGHTIANVAGLQSAIDGKANSSHTHDDRYFTEGEINTKLAGKANSSHNHSGSQITSGTIPLARMPQITAAYLAADSVGQSELAANAVTSGHIVDGTITESDLSTAVKNKLNATPTVPKTLSGLLPNNRVTNSAYPRHMRIAPGNQHNVIITLGSGWGFHDTGYRQTTDEPWAYCMLPGVGFGWISLDKFA